MKGCEDAISGKADLLIKWQMSGKGKIKNRQGSGDQQRVTVGQGGQRTDNK